MEPQNKFSLLPYSTDAEEWLADGVVMQWAAERRLCVLIIKDVRRSTVDVWARAVATLFADYRDDAPLLCLYDFSAEGLAITPYLFETAQRVTRANDALIAERGITGRTAILVRETALTKMAQPFVNRLSRIMPGRELRVLSDRGQAVAWLLEAAKTD